jgi:uncharacterized membrane protein YcfT
MDNFAEPVPTGPWALQFLRFIVGRHDLPFYYSHSARLQLFFLYAFLKDNDHDGWKIWQQARVHLCLCKGTVAWTARSEN